MSKDELDRYLEWAYLSDTIPEEEEKPYSMLEMVCGDKRLAELREISDPDELLANVENSYDLQGTVKNLPHVKDELIEGIRTELTGLQVIIKAEKLINEAKESFDLQRISENLHRVKEILFEEVRMNGDYNFSDYQADVHSLSELVAEKFVYEAITTGIKDGNKTKDISHKIKEVIGMNHERFNGFIPGLDIVEEYCNKIVGECVTDISKIKYKDIIVPLGQDLGSRLRKIDSITGLFDFINESRKLGPSGLSDEQITFVREIQDKEQSEVKEILYAEVDGLFEKLREREFSTNYVKEYQTARATLNKYVPTEKTEGIKEIDIEFYKGSIELALEAIPEMRLENEKQFNLVIGNIHDISEGYFKATGKVAMIEVENGSEKYHITAEELAYHKLLNKIKSLKHQHPEQERKIEAYTVIFSNKAKDYFHDKMVAAPVDEDEKTRDIYAGAFRRINKNFGMLNGIEVLKQISTAYGKEEVPANEIKLIYENEKEKFVKPQLQMSILEESF
jgi:hypothetical protein